MRDLYERLIVEFKLFLTRSFGGTLRNYKSNINSYLPRSRTSANNISVIAEMSLLLLLLLLLPISNCEQSGLEDAARDDPTEETMNKSENPKIIEDKFEELVQRMERMDMRWKLEKTRLETKNLELVEKLEQQLEGVKVQFESRLEQVEKVATLEKPVTVIESKAEEIASMKSEVKMQCKAEVKKEVNKVLPTAVEEGLRDLPFEMVCAFKEVQEDTGVVGYNRITTEFNNSDRPGGADGTMNIETGVFTTVTSGYYIVTFSGYVWVHPGEDTQMYLYHNGDRVVESKFETSMHVGIVGSAIEYIIDQGSRTVVSISGL